MNTTLHLICGLPGAGKTTLGLRLERESGCQRFCPDEWIHALLEDHGDREEMNRLRDVVESIQRDLAMQLLKHGVSVVLENGFWGCEERLSYLAEARSLGADVVLHFLDVPKSELKARIEARNRALPSGSFHVEPREIEEWFDLLQRPNEDETRLYTEFVESPGASSRGESS